MSEEEKQVSEKELVEVSRYEIRSGKCIDCLLPISVDMVTYRREDGSTFECRERSVCDCYKYGGPIKYGGHRK